MPEGARRRPEKFFMFVGINFQRFSLDSENHHTISWKGNAIFGKGSNQE